MVILQVFGRPAVYRVAARRCLRIVSALLSVVYGATPCTIDVTMRCYCNNFKMCGGFARVLRSAIAAQAMPSLGHHKLPR